MRIVLAMLLAAVPLAAGCGKKAQAKQGLPPAESWDQASGPGALASLDDMQRPRSTGERSSNPHAGVPGAPPLDDDGDMGGGMGGMGGMAGMGGGMAGGNPHAGVPGAPPLDDDGDTGGGMGGNPHAGMDMGSGGGANPHAGGGIDVTQLGIAPPDPARKIDPSRRVRGTIRLAPKVKDRVKANGAVFLVIRRAGTDGQPTGSPLAVEKLLWSGDALPFELTEANAMSGGTALAGDVVVMARFDQDSDALSKQPGDVTGQVRAKVPADKLELMLDTVLP